MAASRGKRLAQITLMTSSMPQTRNRFIIPSNYLASLLEAQARRARKELARIAMAEVAQEIGFDRRPREEGRVHLGVIEARHRPAIEAQRPRRQHEIRALQRPVSQRDVLQHILRQVLEPRL